MGPPHWTVVRHTVTVAGVAVPGDMLYVGHRLAAASGRIPEPSLIDPWLPVDWHSPDWRGETMPYWPSYSTISPAARAAYLRWLTTGRRHPEVPIGYVFLFFYGLERRVLVELPHLPQAQPAELPVIRAEVDQLLRVYGGNTSFAGYARRFREVLDIVGLLESDVCAGPAPAARRDAPPARLRLGLSGFATTGRPLPADWALSWLRSSDGFFSDATATRCEPEFVRLFHSRYAKRYGHGLVIRAPGRDMCLDYRPASAGFHGWNDLVVHGRPEILGEAPAERDLVALGEECAQALDAFHRFLGHEPGGRGSVAATGLLPAELQDLESGEAGTLVSRARALLGGSSPAVVRAEDLFAGLPFDRPSKKKDVVAIARLLAAAKIGMEPDPRLGGPAMTEGPIVLFAEPEPCSAPSPEYSTATLLLHLGVAVSAADGRMAEQEKDVLAGQLERALHLTDSERGRLRAHLAWLLTGKVKLTGLARRVSALDRPRREDIAEFLATVARADGVIDAAEVTMLRRIRELLGLDPEELPADLLPAPGTVRAAGPANGHPIPAPSTSRRAETRVRLDEVALAEKLAESAEVAALLNAVFAEEEPQPVAPPPPVDLGPVADLDVAHSSLLRALAGRDTVSRGEWERLAADARLMPDGALDRINESAYELLGEPVAEGDDPIEINQDAMGELL